MNALTRYTLLFLLLLQFSTVEVRAYWPPLPAIIPITRPMPLGHVEPFVRLGDGMAIRLFGSNFDGFRVEKDGKVIFSKMIGDGVIDIISQKIEGDVPGYNIAARHGGKKNLYYAFAIRGETVIQSKLYRNTFAPDIVVPAQWIGPNVLEIGSSQPTMLSFDPVDNTWSFSPLRIIKISHDIQLELFNNSAGVRIVQRGVKILERNINDGPIGVSFQLVADSHEHFNIALRYGRDGDVYTCLALLEDQLVKSPVLRTRNAESNFGFGQSSEWVAANILEISSHRTSRFKFDLTARQWSQEQLKGDGRDNGNPSPKWHSEGQLPLF